MKKKRFKHVLSAFWPDQLHDAQLIADGAPDQLRITRADILRAAVDFGLDRLRELSYEDLADAIRTFDDERYAKLGERNFQEVKHES